MRRKKVLLVAGARPNFMKIAPVARALAASPDEFEPRIVHTGQHYDEAMSAVFFEQLGIPPPDINLNVGSGTHAAQTGAIMIAFEPVLRASNADLVLVVGDVNSTLACALVAVKLAIPVAHVEAGLRSFDRTMPEEINRVLTDQISDLLFTTESSAHENLRREGIDETKVHFVGNVMIDTLLTHRIQARTLDVPRAHGLMPKGYVVLTLHRPSNVDDHEVFDRLIQAVAEISRDLPVVFPVHPRTRAAIEQSRLASQLVASGRLRILDPLGYLQFLSLMEASAAVLTDSGGIQEETTILQIPCLTLRETTERPITVTSGTNQIVGTDLERIRPAWRVARSFSPNGRVPERWDGKASERIVAVLREHQVAR